MAFPTDLNVVATPKYPSASLSVNVNVAEGRNQIMRAMNSHSNVYIAPDNARLNAKQFDLVADGSYSSHPSETTSVLVVKVTAPVTFSFTAGGVTTTLTVNKMLVIDQVLDSYTIEAAAATRVYINEIAEPVVEPPV